MKNLLKFTLFAAALIGCVSFANAQVNFGVKAGLNLANMTFSDEFEDPNTKMLITFQVGGIVDIPLSENFVVQPGLLLVGKGAKSEIDFLGETLTSTVNPMYLQVPVMFLYQGNMFYAGVGPYVGFGLFGNAKSEIAGESDTESLDFGNTVDDDFAPLDFGGQVEAGVALPMGLRIGAGYALGLANAIPKDAREGSDASIKHGVISVNVAYMFGGGDE